MERIMIITLCVFISTTFANDVRFEILKFIPHDGAPRDNFGCAVALNDRHIAIGSRWDNTPKGESSGSVTVYTFDGKSWGNGTLIIPDDLSKGDKFGNSLAISKNHLIISAPWSNRKAFDVGAAYIYVYNGTQWLLEQKIVATDGKEHDQFGYNAVDIDGKYAVVGASEHPKGDSSGAAYIYSYNDKNWSQQQKLTPIYGLQESYFGISVAIDDDIIAVGAHREARKGAVYMFKLGSVTWYQQYKVVSSSRKNHAYFGYAIALQGNRLVVGAYGEDSAKGSVYVYTRYKNIWSDEQKLVVSDGKENDYFGSSVSISGDLIVVGAYRSNYKLRDSGMAYLFKYINGRWRETMKLRPSDAGIDDWFGQDVAIWKDKVVAGSAEDEVVGPRSGSAYFFEVDIATIRKVNQKLLRKDASTGDLVGQSVDISGNHIVVGSPNDDVLSKIDSGSVTIFTFNGIRWNNGITLIPKDGGHQDHFGYSTSIHATRIIIGSPGSKHNGVRTGGAYIYAYNGDTWHQEVKLIADNGSAKDRFGFVVGIFYNYAVVSSIYDDDKAEHSGSVYVFMYNGRQWINQSKIVAQDGAKNDLFGSSLAIHSDVIIVGSHRHDFNNIKDSGAIYIYKRFGDKWNFVEKKGDLSPTVSGWFGYSVDINANYLLVGCHTKNSGTGLVYVFKRHADEWIAEQELSPSDGKENDWFGHSVSIHDSNIVVGSPSSLGNVVKSGSVYVYKYISGKWKETMKLVASNSESWDQFGNAVGVSNGRVVVGSPYNNNGRKVDSGSAYVYDTYFSECVHKT